MIPLPGATLRRIGSALLLAHLAAGAAPGLGAIRTQVLPAIPVHGSSATTYGLICAPDPALHPPPWPGVTMLPGGGADTNSVSWAARLLARDGYVAIVVKPTSGSSTLAYSLAAQSGLDFMASGASPFRSATDTTKFGACGWSLGARSLTRTQDEDPRLDALVAWDNLALSESGDAGSPSCSNVPNPIRPPRVPAMGQASESCSAPADAKLTAWTAWRAAGVPSAEVVFAGANHFYWSGVSGTAAQHETSHYYTLAWFDRWLKGDATALDRIVAASVLGVPRGTLLSGAYRSGLFAGPYNCDDLRLACAPLTSGVPPVAAPATLLSVAPNPASGAGPRVTFRLERAGRVDVSVFDIRGRQLRTLVSGELGPGPHEAAWDGRGQGGVAPAGLYFIRLRAAGVDEARRVTLVR